MENEAKTILVIDDDENMTLLCQEVLTGEGYNVMLAKDTREAIKGVKPHLWKGYSYTRTAASPDNTRLTPAGCTRCSGS